MALLNWSEKFILGIGVVDKEHKILIHFINKLYDVRRDGNSEVVSKVINGLVSYVENHFANEENLLKKYNYPEFDYHKSIHNDLAEKVSDLKKKYFDGDTDIGTRLAFLLNDWLSEHILVEDKKHTEYLKSKGVT